MSSPSGKYYKQPWFITVVTIVLAFLVFIFIIAPLRFFRDHPPITEEYAERYTEEFDDDQVEDDIENNRILEDPELAARRADLLNLYDIWLGKPCDKAMRDMYLEGIISFIDDVVLEPRPRGRLTAESYEVSVTGSIVTDISASFNGPVLESFADALGSGMILKDDLPVRMLVQGKYKPYIYRLETYRDQTGTGEIPCKR